ncbi:phosphonate metabolism protein/1,5-bisphosphokinase (PRPP-forming) PhnN [Bradyrhizobium sp. dw_78]|uniref:phosphonate metabolism protein/1,5-bisphosphokinase (PRPP-forming) PhnN n=1 Tax=Bradyrhizobium sp. dw_78 TaxID=2719793 RepID=UPI001BD4436E|nr:phosphonate metabolism protein/1,5-bisphosphokinase (PRPP-forming) PhnN [Bradyrhizobium sp. dw_78]
MTDTLAISGQRSQAIGPGRLILVVGPSGAGKDTLLGLARAACADNAGIVFARRVVTREASSFEDNEQVSHDAFQQALASDAYAMHWEAHGHCYGLPRVIDDEIRAGRTVIANVSRTVVGAMREAYQHVVVVSITAPPQVLAERLAMRARGSDGKIEQRLGRAVDGAAAVPDFTILNVGIADYHARQLVRIIKAERWDD